ncbi:MAG: ketopantoate reductase C-terminal domain-containing protein [Saprospiraceae bacterium]|nr:ketopantoate reductase C-terminal domain-containing protein [Saprospiraceae bacterium]
MKIHVGILGVGAIGSLMATCLRSNPTIHIVYFNRTPKTEINIEYNNQLIHFPILCQTDPTLTHHLDWLLVCLKEYQYENAKGLLENLITKDTKVAVLRNGIHISDSLLPFTTADHILPCILDAPVQEKTLNQYWQLRHPKIFVPACELSDSFKSLFAPDRLTIQTIPDFKTAAWEKLIESSTLGTLQCLTGQPCSVFKDPKIVDLSAQLLEEAIQVALADGAKIELSFKSNMLSKLLSYPPDKGSSMLTDLQKGNILEIDAKIGAILRVAKKHNIDVPLTHLFTTLLRKVNQK